MSVSSLLYSRRTVMQGAAAAACVAALPAWGAPSSLKTMLDQMAGRILRLSPETATGLGLDAGARGRLKFQLADLSPAGEARWAETIRQLKQTLLTVSRATLKPEDVLRYDTTLYAFDRALEGTAFFYGGAANGFFGGAAPYVVSQQNGAISAVPEFLNAQHQIRTRADCEAYLARMRALARQLDQEAARITHDAARGVMPPHFVAKTALGQLQTFRATKPAEQSIVLSVSERATKAGIAGDWQARARTILERDIYPALDRQIAAFTAATKAAPETAGVHRLPEGEAYYRWALRLGTTTQTPAAEIHQLGHEQNLALQARMDTVLRSQGLTQGSVGARVQGLNTDPRFLYPNTEEGRAQLIAYINGRLAGMRALQSKFSHLALKADVTIKRVPTDIQDGAPLGYMNFASLDGLRPAIYYINLKNTGLWPRYQLATLTAHEAVPGHAWQGAYLAENSQDIPVMSSLTSFNAFVEGWALYAEQLVDEGGFYADDPFSQLGYLQAQQFRACRLVVDTGLHAMQWSRERAIAFLMEQTGRGEQAMTSEVDRYCVSPGQACGYKMGHNEILRLRRRAQDALGARFDLAGFNDALVKTGGAPLTVLATAVESYITAAQSKA